MKKVRAGEHEQHTRYDCGNGMQSAAQSPHVRKQSSEEDVERYAEVDGARERQYQIEPIRRTQHGGRGPTEVRYAAEDLRIPERQMTVTELIGGERPPVDEL